MNLESLKSITRSRWSFLLGIWRHRETIQALGKAYEEAEADGRSLRESLHKSKLESADLHERLSLERQDHAKTKRHIQTLWRFIALRHRLDVPAVDGSIRKILMEAERR